MVYVDTIHSATRPHQEIDRNREVVSMTYQAIVEPYFRAYGTGELPAANFSARLAYLREVLGMSQKVFADFLGIYHPTISVYETGRSSPQYDQLLNILDKTGVSSDWLLGNAYLPMPVDYIDTWSDDRQLVTINAMLATPEKQRDMWRDNARRHDASINALKQKNENLAFLRKTATTSELLRVLREAHGLRLSAVSNQVDGLRLTTLQDTENGKRNPGTKFIGGLAWFYGVSCDYLLRRNLTSTLDPDLHLLRSQGYYSHHK